MRVRLIYDVPVSVIVDLDTGEVNRVVVEDEDTKLTDPTEAFDHDADDQALRVDDTEVIQAAADIAETKLWPRWEFGW